MSLGEASPPVLTSFKGLGEALDDCFSHFANEARDQRPMSPDLKQRYCQEVLRMFSPESKELDRMALFDPFKPYTRNLMIESTAYTVALYCWNMEAQSSIHSHPCEFCLHTCLSGSLRIERFNCESGSLHVLNPNKPIGVTFLMEGQICSLNDNLGVVRMTNPRKYVQCISLSLISPPYLEHITWWPNPQNGAASSSSSSSATLLPRRTRIGCYSVRGIRTPRLESKLSLHGKMLNQLKESTFRIPAVSLTVTNTPQSSGSGGRQRVAGKRKMEMLIKKGDDTYQLGEAIGRGSFGAVYQALNRKTGEFVAIKRVLLHGNDGGPQAMESLRTIESEIQLLETLDHPNIIRYIGSTRDTGAFYIITELMESKSLTHVIERFGNFDEALARRYLVQVLSGLQYLHQRSVIHRDIKAGNVLVSKGGVVKLADFGVSTTIPHGETQFTMDDVGSNDIAGSPYWMAPEVIELKRSTPKSDIWSTGCLIIEMLSGYPPYFSLPPLKAFWRIVNDPHPPLPKGASPLLQQLLLRCFVKSTDQRPSVDDMLAHEWMKDPEKQAEAPAVGEV